MAARQRDSAVHLWFLVGLLGTVLHRFLRGFVVWADVVKGNAVCWCCFTVAVKGIVGGMVEWCAGGLAL